jgi:hypothetical protein
MWRIFVKILWNAIPLVALILIVVWLVGFIQDRMNPTQSNDGIVKIIPNRGVLEAIKSVNKQVFIEHYNMVDVEYTEVPQGWVSALGLKQEFIVLVRGRVPAGFDLQQLSEDDIWVSPDGTRAQLTLPPPIIFEDNISIDFENSRVLAQSDSCPSFLCEDNLNALQGEVLPAAQGLLIDYAQENGILDQAARDGKAYYEQFLRSLGFEEVRVIVSGYD